MWKRFKKAWAIYRHISAVRSLLQWLGWWKYVVTVGSAGITAVVAYLMGVTAALPWPYLFLVTLACLCLLLFIAGFTVAFWKAGAWTPEPVNGIDPSHLGNPQSTTTSTQTDRPELSISLYPAHQGLKSYHGYRFDLDDNLFYYSLLVSNEERRYPNKAYGIKASLLFKPYKGQPFEVQEALFFIRDGQTKLPCYELTLDRGETREVILAASRGKFTTFRAWPYEPNSERELTHGQWDCTVSLKAINASFQKTFRVMIESGPLIDIQEV